MKKSEQLKSRWKPHWSTTANYSLETAFITALAFIDKPAELIAELSSSGNLSDKGVQEAYLRDIAKNVGRLKADAAFVERRRTGVKERKANLAKFEFDKTDAAGAIRRMEMRTHIKSLKLGELANFLNDTSNAEFIEAALEMPAAVSGIHPDLHAKIRENYMNHKYPGELASLEDEAELLETINAVQTVAADTIKAEGKFVDPRQADNWFNGVTTA